MFPTNVKKKKKNRWSLIRRYAQSKIESFTISGASLALATFESQQKLLLFMFLCWDFTV